MESVFHEKQEGSLCAQHCLNALLQNHYFSAVDLAQIGKGLDERERERMAEGGIATNEYQHFIESNTFSLSSWISRPKLKCPSMIPSIFFVSHIHRLTDSLPKSQQPSSNYDDSGFFSIQVITEALSVWGLDVIVFNSQNPIAVKAREDPRQMSAFICNYLQHWFSVRKIGNQWFNLNSLLSGPELISDTYLSLFLTQLQQEGYSIFIVVGVLPECEADQVLRLMPAVQTVKPRLLTEKEGGTEANMDSDDHALKEALRVSKEMSDHDDSSLQAALQLSMEGFYKDHTLSFSESHFLQPSSTSAATTSQLNIPSQSGSSKNSSSLTQEELRLKRLAFLDKQSATVNSQEEESSEKKSIVDPDGSGVDVTDPNEEELLQQAIAMSMQQNS